MKELFYIRNTKTDQNFDTIEMKFYDNNWEPQLEEDKDSLQEMINEDPETFKNCIVEIVKVED